MIIILIFLKIEENQERKQMVQRVDGRLRVRGGVIMVRQNKAFLDHVFSLLF